MEAVLTSTHNLCFKHKYEKYQNFVSVNFYFIYLFFKEKITVYLDRGEQKTTLHSFPGVWVRSVREMTLYSPNGFLHVCLKKSYPKHCVVKILYKHRNQALTTPPSPRDDNVSSHKTKALDLVEGK